MTIVEIPERNLETELVPGVEPKARTQWQLFRRRLLRHRLAMVGLVLLAVLLVSCFGARWLAPYPRNDIDLLNIGHAPSGKHLFGTDSAGRDFLTEVLYAGQISLKIGLSVALLSTLFGAAVGAIAGYFGRAVDQVLMRLTDLLLIIPQIAIMAVALKKFGGTDRTVTLVLAGIFWMQIARVVRGQVLALREREFVDAARVAGASSRRIIVRHLLPNMIGPLAVNASLAMAVAIVTESTLSFLGFGVQPPKTSWGLLLANGEEFVGTDKAYLIYFPGLAILLTVLAINFVGDGLRDAFDPQSKR
jgi:peptide/nickel transport system permease protein